LEGWRGEDSEGTRQRKIGGRKRKKWGGAPITVHWKRSKSEKEVHPKTRACENHMDQSAATTRWKRKRREEERYSTHHHKLSHEKRTDGPKENS